MGMLEKVDPILIDNAPEGVVDIWMAVKEFLLRNIIFLYAAVGLVPTGTVITLFVLCVKRSERSASDEAARKRRSPRSRGGGEGGRELTSYIPHGRLRSKLRA